MTTEERYEKYQKRCMGYVKKQIARCAREMAIPVCMIWICLMVLWRIVQGIAEMDFAALLIFLFTAIFSVVVFLDVQNTAESIMYFSKGWHMKAITGRIAVKRRKKFYTVEITAGTEKYEGKKIKKKRIEQKKQKPYLKTRKKANLKFAQEVEIREENREEIFREGDEITMLYTADTAIKTPYIMNYDKTGWIPTSYYIIYAYVEDGTTESLMQELAKGGQVMFSKKEILIRIYLRMLIISACSVFAFLCIFYMLK